MRLSAERRRRFRPDGRVLGVAHRGASMEAPENTLAAFRRALDAEIPAVECDVQRARDGRIVVIHDQTVDRTTDGRGRVADLTFAELRRLDAGRWFGPAFAGERVPALDDVLDLVRGRALLLLEIKNGPVFYEGIEAQVADALRGHGMTGATLVMSFDHAAVRTMREAAPQVATAVVYTARLVDAIGAAQAAHADALCPLWGLLTAEVVAEAHEAGLAVFPWTIDEEAAMRRCLAWGVDGVTSNDARLLARLGSLPA
ncbi:MAG TPA: glycerophosphodiester phosphodiesterase family protein [bacterium]|nr:glycerophosphodiester phosphodiesterase family protein [bacterium]